MDVGKDVRRRRNLDGLAKAVQSGFIDGWLVDNQQNFIDVMNLIRDGAPVKWAELYMKAYQLGLVKEQNINININRQHDREELQALVRARIPGAITDKTYTPFEEVKPQALPLNSEEGH